MSYAKYLPRAERHVLAEAARNLLKDGEQLTTKCQVVFNAINEEAKGLEVCADQNQQTGLYLDTVEFFTHLDDVVLVKAIEARPKKYQGRDFTIWHEGAIGDVHLLVPIAAGLHYHTKDFHNKKRHGSACNATHFVLQRATALLFSFEGDTVTLMGDSSLGVATVTDKTADYQLDVRVVFDPGVGFVVKRTDVLYDKDSRPS